MLSTHFVLSNGLIIVFTCSETVVGIDRRNNVPRGVSSLPSVFKLLVSLIRIFIAADRSTLPSLSFLPRTRTIKSFAVKINDDRDVPVSLFVSICYRHWRAFAIAYTRFLYILRLLFSLPFLFFFFLFCSPPLVPWRRRSTRKNTRGV